jgi:hypothetical protein
MDSMFREAVAFNAAIGKWNTQSLLSSSSMFRDATAFNQAICWPHNATIPRGQDSMWQGSGIGRWGNGTPETCT